MKKNIFSKLMFALAMVVSATVLSSCDTFANMDNGTFLGDMVISGPGVSDHKLTIEMANASGIILANNGVLLSCNSLKGGDIYTFIANPGNQPSGTVPATTDARSYEGNSMVPAIVATNYPTGQFYLLKGNEFHTMSANGKVPACKAVFDTNKQ